MGCCDHVRVHEFIPVGLGANDLEESGHGLLDYLDDMGFEFLKVVLHCDEVVTIVVLLKNLLIQAMVYPTLDDVRVV